MCVTFSARMCLWGNSQRNLNINKSCSKRKKRCYSSQPDSEINWGNGIRLMAFLMERLLEAVVANWTISIVEVHEFFKRQQKAEEDLFTIIL